MRKPEQYWDVSWNPLLGCTPVSEGCEHCWARMLDKRFHGGIHWDGKGPIFYSHVLDRLKHWKKPRKIFVCDMSDIGHEKVKFSQFCRVMGHIMLQPWHTFLFLTKRPVLMAERVDEIIKVGTTKHYLDPLMLLADALGHDYTEEEFARANKWYLENQDQSGRGICDLPVRWPLRNLWQGATCENQKRLDERVPELLKIRAKIRWLSLEPLLGPMDFRDFLTREWPVTYQDFDAPMGAKVDGAIRRENRWVRQDFIRWVVIGCESGPGARPCKIEWVENIAEQLQAAYIPVWIKQLQIDGKCVRDIKRFPKHLQIREYPQFVKE